MLNQPLEEGFLTGLIIRIIFINSLSLGLDFFSMFGPPAKKNPAYATCHVPNNVGSFY